MSGRKYRVMAAWGLALAIALAPVTALAAQTVNITSNHPGSVFGNGKLGLATPTSTQDPNGNTLYTTQATVGGSAYGGYSVNAAVKNNALVLVMKSTVRQNAYGGYGGGTDAVEHNTVAILESKVEGAVYGGYSIGGDLKDNGVEIHDTSTVSGPIYGGYSEQGSATYNLVFLYSSINTSTCDIYGGYSGDSTKDATTGNSLLVSGQFYPHSVEANSINNFSNYYFIIDPVKGKNQALLNVLNEFGSFEAMQIPMLQDFDIYFFGSVADIKPGDVYTLVEASQIATSFYTLFSDHDYTTVLIDGEVTGRVSRSGNSILYTITSVIPFSPGDSYSPTYTSRSLTDKPTGITVSGSSISPQSRLNVTKGYLHPAGCAACDEIRSRQAAGDVVALYDISLTGYHTGAYDVFIPFGGSGAYTVLHCNKGVLEKQSAPYANGGVNTTWSRLSPFAIVRGADITVPNTVVVDPPKTGQGGMWGYGLVLAGLVGLCVMRRRKYGI